MGRSDERNLGLNLKNILKTTVIAAALAFVGAAAPAATVNLSDWAYGDSWGNVVKVGTPDSTNAAGAFTGFVRFSGTEQGFSGTQYDFVTYCVEIDEYFSLPSANMTGYNVIAGASDSKWNNAYGSGSSASNTALRLGQLLSYTASDATIVDTAAKSTSLQLAIWNVIYDNDDTVTGGRFSEKTPGGAYDAYANSLLTASHSWTQALDVYVLQKDGSQDFVLTKDSGRQVPKEMLANKIPEPTSLALVALALGAAGVRSRPGRRQRSGD